MQVPIAVIFAADAFVRRVFATDLLQVWHVLVAHVLNLACEDAVEVVESSSARSCIEIGVSCSHLCIVIDFSAVRSYKPIRIAI